MGGGVSHSALFHTLRGHGDSQCPGGGGFRGHESDRRDAERVSGEVHGALAGVVVDGHLLLLKISSNSRLIILRIRPLSISHEQTSLPNV